jgi:pectin methylesterase-like acyl-CoA thioesterase
VGLSPAQDWDSGFGVFSQQAAAANDQESALVCIDCFLEDHPNVGEGWSSPVDTVKRYSTAKSGRREDAPKVSRGSSESS